MTSAPTAPATPATAPPMPAVVVLACWLLGGVAATRVVVAIGTFYAIPELRWFFAAQPPVDLPLPTGATLAVVLAILSLLMAAVYLALAVLSGRSYAARIVTWVVCGLTVCACTPGALVNDVDAVPWYTRLVLITNVVMLAFAIAAAVLLALPAAHRHYRSRRPPRPPRPHPVPRYGYPYPIPYGPQPPPPPAPPPPSPPDQRSLLWISG